MNNIISIRVPAHVSTHLLYEVLCEGVYTKNQFHMKLVSRRGQEAVSEALEPQRLLMRRLKRLCITCNQFKEYTEYRVFLADYEDFVKRYFDEAHKDLSFRLNQGIAEAQQIAYSKAAKFGDKIQNIKHVSVLLRDADGKLTELKSLLGEITVSAVKQAHSAA